MTTIDFTTTIDATPDKVWQVLADFGNIATWSPGVKASRLTSPSTEGTGVSRECVLAPMGTVQERITEWSAERLMTVEIYENKNLPAFRSALATFELEPIGDRTIVTLNMDYQVGLGPVGASMNAVMMRRMFTKNVKALVAGLKYHVETGRPVDGSSKLPLAEVKVPQAA